MEVDFMNNPFKSIITLEEAITKWEVDESHILNKILNNEFQEEEDVKNINGRWLISIPAMNREFGNISNKPDLILSNMPYANMMYESYIKNAFNCGRGQDPAKLADSSIFDISREDKYFYLAKSAASYAAIIHNNNLIGEFKDLISKEDEQKLSNIAIKICNSSNKDELYHYMDIHLNTIEDIRNDL